MQCEWRVEEGVTKATIGSDRFAFGAPRARWANKWNAGLDEELSGFEARRGLSLGRIFNRFLEGLLPRVTSAVRLIEFEICLLELRVHCVVFIPG